MTETRKKNLPPIIFDNGHGVQLPEGAANRLKAQHAAKRGFFGAVDLFGILGVMADAKRGVIRPPRRRRRTFFPHGR